MKNWITILLAFLSIILNAQDRIGKELFCFEPDVRVFTVYALMNGAGFNIDLLQPDKIRVEVTKYLDTTLTPEFKKKIKHFYYAHGYENDSTVQFWNYTRYALYLSQPPDFYVNCDSCPRIIKDWIGFNYLISEFYQKANMNGVFKKYEEELRNKNLKYKPYAELAIHCITSFCKLPPNYYQLIAKTIYFNLNPLMSHSTAQTELVSGELYLINGLGKETDIPSIEAFLHEPLHHVINPIVDSHKALLQNTELYDFSLNNGFNKLFAYPTWRLIVIESFVRFLNHYINYSYHTHDLVDLKKRIYEDYKLGFLLLPCIYEQIDSFKNSSITISDFYVSILKNMNIEKEKTRIMNFSRRYK
jgi:hypothetical protein